jgi:hypothetical protein
MSCTSIKLASMYLQPFVEPMNKYPGKAGSLASAQAPFKRTVFRMLGLQ